jgi:hypothetical protein
MAISLDPVLAHAMASALAALFLLAGIGKLRDPAMFRATVENYQLLPDAAIGVFAWLLPLAECAAGVLLFAGATRADGALLAAALLLVMTGAIAVNLRRGRTRLDCGCGFGAEVPIGRGLLARNAVLLLAALALLLPVTPRATVWLDVVAALFLALFLFGLHALATALLAHHTRLLSLRNLP